MNTWAKDGIEYTEDQIKQAHPNVGFQYPFNATSLGYSAVLETPTPECTNLQIAVRDGITVDGLGNTVRAWTIVNKFATAVEENAYLAELLSTEKSAKIQTIKDTTDLKVPVLINGVTFNGGDASASAISGAYQLAQLNQEPNVQLWDIDNSVATYSLFNAEQIAKTIAMDYRTKALARQARIMAVNAITIGLQGTYPDYTSAKAALDLI